MNTFSRSWQITKLSFKVISKDKKLLLFPLISGIFSILFLIFLVFPMLVTSNIVSEEETAPAMIYEYGVLFLVYLGISFIAIFFNTCVVYILKNRFEGKETKITQALSYSLSKIHFIFIWSMISATVGVILALIQKFAERLGYAGQIITLILTKIFGLVWGIISLFVIPSMIYHNLDPIQAIKKSVETVKKTWGESLIRHYGLGIIQFILLLLGFFTTIGLIIAFVGLGPYALLTIIIIAIIYVLFIILLFSVANLTYSTALYIYADTGKIPDGFSEDSIKNAFINPKAIK
jgi:uncharacterized membrane protein